MRKMEMARALRYDQRRRMKRGDARAHTRYAAEVDGKMRLAHREIRIRTRNVSRGGLCFLSEEDIVRGSEVDFELALLFEEGTYSESVKLRGRVVWCTPMNGGQWQVGASFYAVTGETRRWLDVFVKYLQAARDRARPDEG